MRLTEEELADTVWALPRSGADPASIPRLDRRVTPEHAHHPLARDTLTNLQLLRRRVHEVTPHEFLAQALAVLRVRPLLRSRYPRQAAQALADVDLYLDLSRSYAIRSRCRRLSPCARPWCRKALSMRPPPMAKMSEPSRASSMHSVSMRAGSRIWSSTGKAMWKQRSRRSRTTGRRSRRISRRPKSERGFWYS
jgi:hypothetical protein